SFTDSIFKHLSLVYNIPLKKEKDLNYHFVCRNISKSIYYQPELLLGFPNEFLSNRAFQLYFIERFPLIDLINKGLKGILIQYRENKDTDEVKVFVGGLLYLNSFKSGLPNKKWLSGFAEVNIEELHPLLQGRYFGSQLLSITHIGKKNRLIDTVKTFLSTHERERQFPFFIFTFIEYAIEDKKFDLVKYLLRRYYNEDDPIDGWVEFGYREVFKIYQFIALVETQLTKEAILLSKTISKERIAFYFRETFWIMYLKALVKTATQKTQITAIEIEIAAVKEFLYPTSKKE
ncbi:MAG TPA: hypothetical protein VJ894_01040, partial [Cryomorphaceae bacterium]|nr:hypothetical protein [Cryomorphaceae bacterium]